MEYEALKLDNQLCFPLYACSRKVVKSYTPYLRAIGLTYTQYITMMVLWEEQGISVKELGRRLHLDSGTLTPLLKKMELLGFVTRQRDKADERCVIIGLTDEGRQLRERAADIPEQIACELPIDDDERHELYRLLHKILDDDVVGEKS
jgi:DNA-binding MarR family transcriptional regulator